MSSGLSVDDAIRVMLLLLPRMVGRVKRMAPPEALESFALAPRHRSLLAYLVFDGPLGVNELARRLEIAPATVSLMVSDLSRQGVIERHEDPNDRRRAIVSISDTHREAIEQWLARSAEAWRIAFEPLTAEQRKMFVETLQTFAHELGDGGD
jgi:DNA-binding MarR family transcriptional regulator